MGIGREISERVRLREKGTRQGRGCRIVCCISIGMVYGKFLVYSACTWVYLGVYNWSYYMSCREYIPFSDT